MADDCSTIADLVDRITRMARGLQYAEGLNPAQWESLRFIAKANRFSRTPGALAVYLGTTKGTASQTLITLERKGYISRVRDAGDRRVTHLDLTDVGAGVLARDPLLSLSAAARQLPDPVAKSLCGGLAQLVCDLQLRHGWREFGVCAHCGNFRGATGAGESQCGLKDATLPSEEARRLCVKFAPQASPGDAADPTGEA